MTTRQQTQTKPPTPLEKLLSDKEQLRRRCAMQQKKLNDDFLYVQENAARLLLSGFSAMLFPDTAAKRPTPSGAASASDNPRTPSAIDYPGIAKELLPVAWSVAKPVLLSWGIRKIQSWFVGFLCGKKNRT